MSSHEQWRDAYELAEHMYKENRAMKRTDLDLYSQIVCARYDSIFCYDPTTDTYSFRNQALTYENPVASKCRSIADVDLDDLKKNTMAAGLDEPIYMNLTPIHVVPPSTMLVFNHTQHRAYGLTAALERVSPTLSRRPTELDMQPGTEFLYKHKDQKCYRVLILAEVGETEVPDNERRYEVAFLDVCQVITLKLKNLHMPVSDLSLGRFPCALHCARLVGVDVLRSGYIPIYNEEIRRMYADKALRKSGISSFVFMTNAEEQRLIVDFPSFIGGECTEADALQAVHGYHSLTDKDPLPISYQQLMNKVVVPLKYKNTAEDYDMNDSDFANISSASAPKMKDNELGECTLGKTSLDNFFKQSRTRMPEVKPVQFKVPEPTTKKTSNKQQQEEAHSSQIDISCDTLDELMVSYRSNAATPKPTFDEPERGDTTPTKVANKAMFGAQKGWGTSPDGWGDETPSKKSQVPPSPKKQPPPKEIENDGWGSEEVPEHMVPVTSSRVEPPTVQRPLKKPVPPSLMSLPLQKPSSILPPPSAKAPLSLIGAQLTKPPVSPLKTEHPPIPKPSFVAESSSHHSNVNLDSSISQKPLTVPNGNSHKDIVLQHRSSPSLNDVPIIEMEPPMIQTEQVLDPVPELQELQEQRPITPPPPASSSMTPLVEESPQNQTMFEKKQSSEWGTPPREPETLNGPITPRSRKNGSSVHGSAVKSIKATEMDDDVFEEQVPKVQEKQEPRPVARRLSAAPDQPRKSPTPRGSTSSVAARLIHASQADLPSDEEDDGWGEPDEEEQPTKKDFEKPKEELVLDKTQSSEYDDQKKMSKALREALQAHKELKTEKLRARFREHFSGSASSREASVSPVKEEKLVVTAVDDVSTKSNCPTVSDVTEVSLMEDPINEFANVPEPLQQLARAFIGSAQEAAFHKNRQAFVSDIFAMEIIALKSPGHVEQRFWKRTIEEARLLEPAFD